MIIICISRRRASSLQDVRVYRGADVTSDHHLLVTAMKMKLKAKSSPTGNTVHNAYNVEQLRVDETNKQRGIKEQIRSSTSSRQYVEESWLLFKDAVNETVESVLGKKRGKRRERWILASTWKIIDERRESCCSNYDAVKRLMIDERCQTLFIARQHTAADARY